MGYTKEKPVGGRAIGVSRMGGSYSERAEGRGLRPLDVFGDREATRARDANAFFRDHFRTARTDSNVAIGKIGTELKLG